MDNSWGSVTLHRDAHGMPLIDASHEPDAYFGLGYAQAQDDLDGVLRQYLLVRGESGDPDRDANQRRWQVLEEARRGFDSLPAELSECFVAFVAGIAAWMDEHPEAVPAWAPPLEPALPIGVNRTVMLYWVITDGVEALRAAGVTLPAVTTELDLGLRPPGSNAWVIRPWRTADGETIVVSDPHLPFGGVFAMYEATVRAPGLHYTGFSFLGAMLPPLAHNRHVAWGVTTGGPLVSDAYRIEVDGDVYRYDDETRKVFEHDGFPYVVHNGVVCPVLARDDEAIYVVCTPYMGLAGEAERQFDAMVRARDAAGLREALAARAYPPMNVLAADAAGDCFYQRTGRVPVRPFAERGVLDGNTSATAWDGIRPAADLVRLDNPAAGFLQNCNTAPDTVAPDPALDPARWHPDVFNDVPGRDTSRSRRTYELLPTAYATGVEQVTAWAMDDVWPDTRSWQARLAGQAAADPGRVAAWPPGRRALLHRLLAFDGRASADSTEATAWQAWRDAITDEEHLLTAVENAEPGTHPYGQDHELAPGVPGCAGGIGLDVPLRATYYAKGRAYAGGPCLRIVAFGAYGMRSWSVSMPGDAGLYGRGEVKPIVFDPS
ncbi:penicillin acylase family protein [Nonomuraea sp. NBC_01738]|uniref:penicillin acylase family protein n=1 Tax=Nonomuraea sp. NBC_01738 TaxID=2976003 RepID=UPI002E100F3B|nr:penicillin acylase family protein [Nonomuraea sp. NBC_01738]